MATFNKAEKDFFVVMLKEEARTVLWQVGSSADPDELVKSCLEDLQALAPREDGVEDRTDDHIWRQVQERLLKAAYATRPFCVRCGTCCSKGSPTLTTEDFALFSENVLKPEHLVTIREGEQTYSLITETIEPATEELIKIREKDGTTTCIFYQSLTKDCAIYESRPFQCRSQECWNPESSEHIVHGTPIGRETLLKATGSLWDVIQRHDERCSHAELQRAVFRLGATKGQTVEDVLELLRFDHHVRWFLTEKLNLEPAALDFFLGRPLTEAIKAYGLQVEQCPDGSFLLSPIE
jgi:Fe-S-cluster containining protein